MRYSSNPEVGKFLKVYDDTPKFDRDQIPFSAFAIKAGCNIPELLGAIVLCFRDYQAQKSAIKVMAAHPKVLDSTIMYAGMPGGERDRRMIHEMVGAIKTPKGTNINFNFGNDTPEPEKPEDTPPEVNEIFPVINSKQEEWQGKRQKLLSGS